MAIICLDCGSEINMEFHYKFGGAHFCNEKCAKNYYGYSYSFNPDMLSWDEAKEKNHNMLKGLLC